jgi:hypothetical protein
MMLKRLSRIDQDTRLVAGKLRFFACKSSGGMPSVIEKNDRIGRPTANGWRLVGSMSVDIEGKEPSSTSNLINNHEFLAINQGKEMERKEEDGRVQAILEAKLYLAER